MKTHNITTIKQIIDVVDEKNLKGFLADFSNWLAMGVAVKKVVGEHPEMLDIKRLDVFKWIDDGKTDIKMTINIKEKL